MNTWDVHEWRGFRYRLGARPEMAPSQLARNAAYWRKRAESAEALAAWQEKRIGDMETQLAPGAGGRSMTATLRDRLATALHLAAADTPMAIYALPGDDALWLPIADAILEHPNLMRLALYDREEKTALSIKVGTEAL